MRCARLARQVSLVGLRQTLNVEGKLRGRRDPRELGLCELRELRGLRELRDWRYVNCCVSYVISQDVRSC